MPKYRGWGYLGALWDPTNPTDEVAAAYEGRAIVIDEYEQEGWVAMVLKTC